MTYATPAEYRATPGAPPVQDDVQLLTLLEDASARLDELTVQAIYAVDLDGMPTGAGVASAFRRATIQQARHQIDNPDAGDGTPQGAMTLGPLQLPGTTGTEGRFSAAAVATLTGAGLISRTVQSA